MDILTFQILILFRIFLSDVLQIFNYNVFIFLKIPIPVGT